ncbi:MAG: conserved phage C-terminal domain-containing protein, partial [Pseudomonadales bacterium]|nr:conserved phage C-terminal domain-containing protein [Pseudomonadales bacterium]
FAARLLFEGLWCVADYMGRLKYVPLEIKMEIFPADDVDVEELIAELDKQNLIVIYLDHSGTTLVQVVNFTKHQNPHVNERIGKDKNPLPCLPSEDECKPIAVEVEEEKPSYEQQLKDALVLLREYSESDPADSLSLIPDSLSLIPKDSMSGKPDDAAEVIKYLNSQIGSNYQPVESNTSLIRARMSEGRTVEEIKSVIDRKVLEWPKGNAFRQYLRPSTLFNAARFNDYYGQLNQPLPGGENEAGKSTYQQRIEQENAATFDLGAPV